MGLRPPLGVVRLFRVLASVTLVLGFLISVMLGLFSAAEWYVLNSR